MALMVLVLASCDKPATEYQVYSDALEEITAKSVAGEDVVVVIPGEGCGGCISDATSFMFSKIDLKEVKLVFTGVKDRKLLALQVGDEFLARSDVFLDAENLFMHQELKSIYPRILTTEGGRVAEVMDFDASFFAE